MSRVGRIPVLACFALLSLGASARAEEASITGVAAPSFEVSGFMDVTYGVNATGRSGTFALSEFELDLKKSFGSVANVRVDVNFSMADALTPNGQLTAPNYDRLVEQAYVSFTGLKSATGLTFTAGKFNAPLGFESSDSPERYQVTPSNLNIYATPLNLIGGMVSWEKGPLTLLAHVSRGWDVLVDKNSSQTFGARAALSLGEGKTVLGLSATWGPEGTRDGDARTVFDFDMTAQLTDDFLLGLEVNYGTEQNGSAMTPGTRAHWAGGLATLHYRVREWLGATLRYDVLYDPDGALVKPGVPQTLHSLTAAALFRLRKGTAPFGVVTGTVAALEYRFDASDAAVFEDHTGASVNRRHTVTAKLVYTF